MPTVTNRGSKLLPEAGRRVEALMRAAMRESDRARTVSALATLAQVQRQTVYDIWHGRPPKPGTVEALVQPLRLSPGAFWAAWEGREEPVVAGDSSLVSALRDQTAAIAALAEALRPLTERQLDERLVALEAVVGSLARGAIEGAGARPARRARAG